MNKKNNPEVVELANNVFDSIVAIDEAYALLDLLYNDFFAEASPTDEIMGAIAVRYSNISRIFSLILGLIHDSIKSFEKNDLY